MKPIRIAQISDFHFTCTTWNPFRLCSKRLLGLANWLFCRKDIFSKEQVFALPKLIDELGVDRVFLGGDFTTTSLPSEYAIGAEFVGKFKTPTISIPGNHDHYTRGMFRNKVFYRYINNEREFKHRAHFFTLPEQRVEAHELGENFWLVAIDTSRATSSHSARGLFSKKIEENLLELLSLLPQDGKILILNHYPFFQNDVPHHTLERGEALEEIVRKDLRIKAFLHGHTHQHIIAALQGLPLILDSGSCADSRRGSWNLLTIDDKGIQIDVYEWKKRWAQTRTENIAWTR